VNDLELLAVQAEHSFDRRGRMLGWHGFTIACTTEGQRLWIGAEVPEATATQLAATFEGAPRGSAPDEAPPALELCRNVLEPSAPSSPCTSGPNFLIETTPPPERAFHIERSDRWTADLLPAANPGNWEPVEWSQLLAGQLGPWAMAIEHGIVAAICHTPVGLTKRAAECGVWTHPGLRGRGFGAAVVTAWADLLRPSGRCLFYATSANNIRSRRLAQRLRLRPIGWTWRLGRPR
jgi:RimJ/RimL family protein N-acetyltransferase